MPTSPSSSFETVICIPCNWSSQTAFLTSLLQFRYIYAGMILLNIQTSEAFTLEIHDRDERMADAFRNAGLVNQVPTSFIDSIDQHSKVLYLIGETGSPQKASSMAHAANALLKAGGTGIKIETAGKAFTRERWDVLTSDLGVKNLYQMFVMDSIQDADGTVYSCGMQNLGLKDTIVSGLAFQEAVDLIRIFSYYQLIDKPTIKPGHTFSPDAAAPVFRILETTKQPYTGFELFENPYGMWRLEHLAGT